MNFHLIFAFAALLTVAIFAGQCRSESTVKEEEKIAEDLVIATGAKLGKECYGQMKTSLLQAAKTTMRKYADKIKSGSGFYKEDKTLDMQRFFKNSLMVKTGKNTLKDCVQKAEVEMNKAIERSIDAISTKVENWFKKGGQKLKTIFRKIMGKKQK